MNLGRLTDTEMLSIKKNILRGYGEVIPYEWVDVEPVEVVSEEDSDAPKKMRKKEYIDMAVPKTYEYYVGKMSLYQTSGIIAVLGAVFVNGANFKDTEGREDNIVFLEFLDEYHLGVLASLVLGESREWLTENWDVVQVFRIMKAFFKYNDFFALLREAGAIGQEMGLSEEKVRQVALGKASLLAG